MAEPRPLAPSWGGTPIDLAARDLPALKARYLIERAPLRGRVLEVGSGEGKFLRTLARARPELSLVGVDVRDVPPADGAYEFRRSRGPLPAAPGEFVAIIVNDVLEHVAEPERLLEEIYTALAPGGLFLAFIPLEGERFSFYSLYRHLLGQDLYRATKHHVQAFTRAGISELVGARFELVDVEHAYHLLGHALDASFFAVARSPRLERFWWQENAYYHPERRALGAGARALNALLTLGNRVAYAESRLLRRQPWFSTGLLLTALRP